MTDEKLIKANLLKKEIDSLMKTIGTLNDFLDVKFTDVRLSTPHNSCLQYIFKKEQLKYVVDYLSAEYKLKLEDKQKQYEEL